MTTRYQTQCPKCQTAFPMPEKQLQNPKAKARCGRCQHIFLVNEHLSQIEEKSAITTSVQSVAPVKPKPEKKQPKATVNTDDGLIHDDMDIEYKGVGNIDELADFSIDDMSSWLEKEVSTVHKPTLEAHKKEQSVEDESWLEDLISSNNNSTYQKDDDNQNKDLDTLLNTYGANEVSATISQDDYLTRVNSRLPSTPTSQQLATKKSPISMLFWLIGCVLMVLLMGVQYVVFNADELAKDPKKALQMQSICNLVGCTAPSADLSTFKISHLQHRPSHVEVNVNKTDIMAVLSNISDTPQLFPNLKMQIYGDNGLLGEIILAPSDYLMVRQRLLNGKQNSLFMLTVDVPYTSVARVEITPFY